MTDTYYDADNLTFQWDDEKEKLNIEKHGIDFATASHVFNDIFRIEWPDLRHSTFENRYITIGLVEQVLFVVYCDRYNDATGNTDIRLISARKANSSEISMYNDVVRGRK